MAQKVAFMPVEALEQVIEAYLTTLRRAQGDPSPDTSYRQRQPLNTARGMTGNDGQIVF